MNIFKGARRIVYLIASITVLVVLFYNITYQPHISINYSKKSPSAPLKRTNDLCPYEAENHYFTKKDRSGDLVSVGICFLAVNFGRNDEQYLLIPYKIDKNEMMWGGEKYSNEVTDYKNTIEKNFEFSVEDLSWIKGEKKRSYWENFRENTRSLVIALMLFFGIVWGVGWVVRGFMGIPNGMDHKADSKK